MGLIEKLLYTGKWECYYRSSGGRSLWSNDEICDDWKKVKVSRRYWCADPFLVSEGDMTYMFCELMDCKTSRGLLGAGLINDDNVKIRVIKDLGCHTSYPDVFKIDEQWYMIPETVERHTIELYQAINFPYEWDKIGTLLDNVNAVDSTVFFIDEKPYVFIYTPSGRDNQLSIGTLNLEQKKIEKILDVKKYNDRLGRPAGKTFLFNDQMCRPTQYCVKKYGESLVLKQFMYNPISTTYSEEDIRQLTVKDIFPLKLASRFNGLHTYNSSNGVEVIDVHKTVLSVIRPFELVFKRLGLFGYRYNANGK